MTAVLTPYLRGAPPYQPPYDDEVDAAARRDLGAWTQELPFEAEFDRPPAANPPRPQRTCPLPDPAPWARRFIQAVLESLTGRRPAAQLQAWTSTSVFLGLQRACARSGERRAQPPVAVRSVHVSEPTDGVAEVCAVVLRPDPQGPRYRAVAARLEGVDGQWRCVTLQIG